MICSTRLVPRFKAVNFGLRTRCRRKTFIEGQSRGCVLKYLGEGDAKLSLVRAITITISFLRLIFAAGCSFLASSDFLPTHPSANEDEHIEHRLPFWDCPL
jgi:hypothetical protein